MDNETLARMTPDERKALLQRVIAAKGLMCELLEVVERVPDVVKRAPGLDTADMQQVGCVRCGECVYWAEIHHHDDAHSVRRGLCERMETSCMVLDPDTSMVGLHTSAPFGCVLGKRKVPRNEYPAGGGGRGKA